jgi:hypothetical protein
MKTFAELKAEQVARSCRGEIQAGAPRGNKNAAKYESGQKVKFEGKSADGSTSGMFEVEVVNPHSNADKVTHTDNRGRMYEGAFSHIPTATVKNTRSGKVFEAHHYTLGKPEVKAFSTLKSSNSLLATYRQIAVRGDEPVFIKCAGTSEGVAKSWESRRAKMADPSHLAAKISEHDTAMHSARTPEEFSAHEASKKAYSLSDKAAASGSAFDHMKARAAHLSAHIKHFNADNKSEHAADHKDAMSGHESAAAHINAEKLKNEPKKPFWKESHPNRDWRGGSHKD